MTLAQALAPAWTDMCLMIKGTWTCPEENHAAAAAHLAVCLPLVRVGESSLHLVATGAHGECVHTQVGNHIRAQAADLHGGRRQKAV